MTPGYVYGIYVFPGLTAAGVGRLVRFAITGRSSQREIITLNTREGLPGKLKVRALDFWIGLGLQSGVILLIVYAKGGQQIVNVMVNITKTPPWPSATLFAGLSSIAGAALLGVLRLLCKSAYSAVQAWQRDRDTYRRLGND